MFFYANSQEISPPPVPEEKKTDYEEKYGASLAERRSNLSLRKKLDDIINKKAAPDNEEMARDAKRLEARMDFADTLIANAKKRGGYPRPADRELILNLSEAFYSILHTEKDPKKQESLIEILKNEVLAFTNLDKALKNEGYAVDKKETKNKFNFEEKKNFAKLVSEYINEQDPQRKKTLFRQIAKLNILRLSPDKVQGLQAQEQTAAFENLKLQISHASLEANKHAGYNEDRVLVNPNRAIFALADGLTNASGSMENVKYEGEKAAEKVLERIDQSLAKSHKIETGKQVSERISEVVLQANRSVALETKREEEKIEKGKSVNKELAGQTTLSLVQIDGERAFITNVGDSRVYVRNEDGKLERVTQDDSLFAALAESYLKPTLGKNDLESNKSAISSFHRIIELINKKQGSKTKISEDLVSQYFYVLQSEAEGAIEELRQSKADDKQFAEEEKERGIITALDRIKESIFSNDKKLPEDMVKIHRMLENAITSAMGDKENLSKPKVKTINLKKVKEIFLCSDGLSDNVLENDLQKMLASGMGVEEIIKKAYANAVKSDDITAMLIKIEELKN